MRIKNVSPLGELQIPLVGTVEAGGVLDVPDQVAESLLEQHDNFVPADSGDEPAPAPAAAETTPAPQPDDTTPPAEVADTPTPQKEQ